MIAAAVCFLWHWPSTGLHARVPDVIRHTTLWSSDFPLPEALADPGSDRPVLLPAFILSPNEVSNLSRSCPKMNFLHLELICHHPFG